MKQLVLISGKGGTGKTIVSASFAALAENKVMADCDVDAANLFLLLQPQTLRRSSFSGGKKARINPENCSACGACLKVCRFNAILQDQPDRIVIDPFSCEGCAVCSHVCPTGAIMMESAVSGEIFISATSYGPFVHARLGIGEESSGKLVTEVRKRAREIAEQENHEYILIDGPPGIGCPVIAALSGTELALIITEPTLSGIHDMQRVCATAGHFNIETACCINKYDINPDNTARIEDWCAGKNIPVLGKIPFDNKVTESMVNLTPVVRVADSPGAAAIKALWLKTAAVLKSL